MAIGLARAGYAGALAAWLGFTLPSAAAMILFALGIATWGDFISAGFLHGLKLAAVAVVAQGAWGMGSKLCTDRTRIALAIAPPGRAPDRQTVGRGETGAVCVEQGGG